MPQILKKNKVTMTLNFKHYKIARYISMTGKVTNLKAPINFQNQITL